MCEALPPTLEGIVRITYPGISAFWQNGTKMIDFGVPSQRWGKGPVRAVGLAREGF